MEKEFYCEEKIMSANRETAKLTYYLLTDSVSEEFCDLKVYGVEIDRTAETKRAHKEKKIIPDLFFDRGEAVKFLEDISKKHTEPTELKLAVNEYIGERLVKSV